MVGFNSQFANPVYLNTGAMEALVGVAKDSSVAKLQEINAKYTSAQAAAGGPIPKEIFSHSQNLSANVSKGCWTNLG